MKDLKDLFKVDYFDLASRPLKEIKEWFKVSEEGFSDQGAAEVREKYGDNEIDYGTEKPLWKIVVEAYFTPFTLVLFALAVISFLTDFIFVPVDEQEIFGPVIIVVLVFLSGTMTLIQTLRSNRSIEELESMVEVTSDIKRNGEYSEIRTEDIVVGDWVRLSAGDMIPADIRLVETKDLFISQTSLTGESYPVEKRAEIEITEATNETAYETLAFTGTEVVSGSAKGIVVRTGNNTLFGDIADELAHEEPETSLI